MSTTDTSEDRYEVTFSVTVEFAVKNPDVIRRVLDNVDGWRDHFYQLDEREAAAMLADCVGIRGIGLSHLDGWADMDDDGVDIARTDWSVDYVVKNGEWL